MFSTYAFVLERGDQETAIRGRVVQYRDEAIGLLRRGLDYFFFAAFFALAATSGLDLRFMSMV